MRRRLAEAGAVPGGEERGIGGVGLQQQAPPIVAHDVGEELAIGADRRQPLRDALFLAPDDVDHGQRQKALRGFLQGRIEDLVHLVANKDRGERGRRHP